MNTSLLKRRAAAAAAAAVMSVTAITGSTGSLYPLSHSAPYITAVAAENSVKFISSAGFGEGIYAQWQSVPGASGYNVYVDGIRIDSMLIRQYPGYMRADAVGLTAGEHTMKVVPVIGGSEDASKAAEIKAAATKYDRSGYGFVNGSSSGAYNADGTLKSNALVVYVTDANKDTVKASVDSTGKGATEVSGIQNIIAAYKKGKESRPLCVRFIGNITDPADMPKGDLMLDTVKAGITVEGIGNDTVFNGFGLVMKNCSDVEVRNIGFMNCDSSEGDDCGLQQNNDHVWVHNCDFFYGHAGSDADQVKGDGALDTKTSTYVTHSYNHFWDNGKCNLQGMKSETIENYITYHHNWYDHSDSRHPRIRTCTVHIYNNYYDGNAKYGVGVTMGASAFVENNYFRNCNYPMLISMQGSDTLSGGTFSGEDGGVIKSYGNYIEGAKSYVTYQQDHVEFDAYEASSRYESVPLSVKAKRGGTTYTDFDIASDFYSYTPDKAEDVPAIVTADAGRVDGGDFKWSFDNSVDDSSSSVNQGLKDALTNYKSAIIAIGSGFTEDSTPPPEQSTTTTSSATTTTTTSAPETSSTTSTEATTGSETTSSTTTTTAPPVPPAKGAYIHNFTENGTESSFYTISGNLSTSKGTVTYNGLTLTQCLKMESATNIDFTAASGGMLTLVFVEPEANVKIDGTKYTSAGDGIITAELSAGNHTITKADTANLFYMVYAPIQGPDCTEPTPEELPGDANCDGNVDVSDAVLIMQALANPNKYGRNGSHENHITEMGEKLGDVNLKGGGITNQDALSIQMYLLGLIDSLPESYQ